MACCCGDGPGSRCCDGCTAISKRWLMSGLVSPEDNECTFCEQYVGDFILYWGGNTGTPGGGFCFWYDQRTAMPTCGNLNDTEPHALCSPLWTWELSYTGTGPWAIKPNLNEENDWHGTEYRISQAFRCTQSNTFYLYAANDVGCQNWPPNITITPADLVTVPGCECVPHCDAYPAQWSITFAADWCGCGVGPHVLSQTTSCLWRISLPACDAYIELRFAATFVSVTLNSSSQTDAEYRIPTASFNCLGSNVLTLSDCLDESGPCGGPATLTIVPV